MSKPADSSKDVKRPSQSAPVLSAGVSGATPASLSRFVDWQIVGPGGSSVASAASGKASSGDVVVRSSDQLLRQGGPEKGVGVSRPFAALPPLLGSLGFKGIDDAKSFLRSELLTLRASGRHEGSLAEWKHFYGVGSNGVVQAEQSYPLVSIAGGTSVSGRITNTVKLRKMRIKYRINRVLNGTNSSVVTNEPTIHIVVWRDKIPVTPGTAPTLKGSDTNPPSSATLPFSILTGADENLLIRNPITEDAYHIYAYHKVRLTTANGYSITTVGSGLGLPPPVTHYGEFDIDLHGLEQKYTTYATSTSDINNLWMTMWSPTSYTNQGFSDTFYYVADTEFEDAQD